MRDRLLQVVSREQLQKVLDGKARKLSYSAVADIRWFLNAIFKLPSQTAASLATRRPNSSFPKVAKPGATCDRKAREVHSRTARPIC